MKRYLSVIVFVIGSLLYFLFLIYRDAPPEEPGYMEPTGRLIQEFVRNT